MSRFAEDAPLRDLSDHYAGEACPRCNVETRDGELCVECADRDEWDRAMSFDGEDEVEAAE